MRQPSPALGGSPEFEGNVAGSPRTLGGARAQWRRHAAAGARCATRRRPVATPAPTLRVYFLRDGFSRQCKFKRGPRRTPSSDRFSRRTTQVSRTVGPRFKRKRVRHARSSRPQYMYLNNVVRTQVFRRFRGEGELRPLGGLG